jgi:serine/threonine protein kinase
VGQTVLAIAILVDRYHKTGKIHGDLKPNNVLLTANQPTLIDEFGLEAGQIAPGWTPDWSPAEQILGNPVTLAADVYPLGIMLLRLIGGRLVGEVRKFRTIPQSDGRDEFDIFYEPFVYVDPTQSIVSRDGLRDWLKFTRTCLAFDPEKRPASVAEFVDKFGSLLTKHPLRGDIVVAISGTLNVARLPDGSLRVVRLLEAQRNAGSAFFRRPPTQLR